MCGLTAHGGAPYLALMPELSADERRSVRAAGWVSVVAYLNVVPSTWLGAVVSDQPRLGPMVAYAVCLGFGAVFAVYWTGRFRLVLAQCFGFTRAHGALFWGAWLSALSTVPFVVEPLARGLVKTGLHGAGSILSILSLALLFHAGVLLRDLPGTLFSLKRWFLPCWLGLTGALLVLVALGAVLPAQPSLETPLDMTAAMVSLLAVAVVLVTGIPTCAMSVLILLRAARESAPAPPRP